MISFDDLIILHCSLRLVKRLLQWMKFPSTTLRRVPGLSMREACTMQLHFLKSIPEVRRRRRRRECESFLLEELL